MKTQLKYFDIGEDKTPESQFLKVLMDRKASWTVLTTFLFIFWTWALQRQQLKALNLHGLDKRDVLITIYIAWVGHPFDPIDGRVSIKISIEPFETKKEDHAYGAKLDFLLA